MFIKLIIPGFIILMVAEEVTHALKPLRRQNRQRPKLAWPVPMSYYNCHLLETCTKGGQRACGWDELFGWLAYFKDICAMYEVNCKARGRVSFVVQNNIVCRMKAEFVGMNKTVMETDLPTVQTTTQATLYGANKTTAWWWQGSTTDQYKYLQNLHIDRN